MANMFSGNTEKRIPKNMEECIKPDSVSSNLWVWCERLEVLGKVLFWIIIVLGLFTAITTAISTDEIVSGSYYKYTERKTSFDIVVFITLIIEVLIYAFIEYCVYHVLALLIGALASIVQNTKVTANLALYNSIEKEEDSDYSNYTTGVHNIDSFKSKESNQKSLNYFKDAGKNDVDEETLNKYYAEERKNTIQKILLCIAGVIIILVMIVMDIKSR